MISMAWAISLIAPFARLIWLFSDSPALKKIDKYYRVALDLFFGVFSCVVLLFIYIRILFISRKLSRQTASQMKDINFNHGQSEDRDIQNISSKRRRRPRRNSTSIAVLGSVIFLFVMCYSLNIYISFCSNFQLRSVSTFVGLISLLLVHCNSCVNIVVYAFMKSDIRRELKRLCRCGSPRDLQSQSREFSLNQAGNTSGTL